MKIVLLVLIATAAIRCVDTAGQEEIKKALDAVPALESQPRELRGVAFSAFVHKTPQRQRKNQGENDLPDEGVHPNPPTDSDPQGDPDQEPLPDYIPTGEDQSAGSDDQSGQGGDVGTDIPYGDDQGEGEGEGEGEGAGEGWGEGEGEGEGEGAEADGSSGEEGAADAFEQEVSEYHELDLATRIRNLQNLKDSINQFKAEGAENLSVNRDQLEDFLLALRDYDYILQAYLEGQHGSGDNYYGPTDGEGEGEGEDEGEGEGEGWGEGEGQGEGEGEGASEEGGYFDPDQQEYSPEYQDPAGEPEYNPEGQEVDPRGEDVPYGEDYRRRQRRNQGTFNHFRTNKRIAFRSAAVRVRVPYRAGLFKRPAYRQQAVHYRTPQKAWPKRHNMVAYKPYQATNWKNRRWLDTPQAYGGNAAQFKNVQDLLVLVSGAATIYNTLFSPLPTNGTNPPSGLQQAVYYLQLYATIRNFAISFTSNRAGIENNLNQVLNNATALGFSKNEMLAFYGYLDLVNSLRLSTQAFTAPFIAQDQKLNTILSNFTNTLKTIVQDVKFLMEQNQAISDATKALNSNDPSVANPTMQNFQQIDATIMMIPNLLSIYANIQGTIADLQAQLNNLQAIRIEVQSVVSNMQLIVNGQADQVKNNADKLFATAVIALVYSILG